MRHVLIAATALAVAVVPALAAAQDTTPATPTAPCRSTVTGDVRLHDLHSRIFGNSRKVRVLVPPGYDAADARERRYPVLYMLDGQNLFDACLSDVSRHEWQVDETVYQLIAEGRLPPMIVVGIDHAGKDRAHEYLPYKDYVGGPDMAEPAGRAFPDFLTNEVMPLVDAQYRTLRGHANTGIGGSSYGGVASLYALIAKPQSFGYGLVESPTLWIGMGQLVRDTDPLVAMPRKVFVAFGGREGDDAAGVEKMIGLIRRVETHFRTAGYDETNFRFVVEPEALHTETAWAARLPGALEFLYGSWREGSAGPF
jgi:predicted alpha/beta superfamily hydrolase